VTGLLRTRVTLRETEPQLRILSIKLGSDAESQGIIQNLRDLIPDLWIGGVEEHLNTSNSVFDLVLTSHHDAYLGHYEKVNLETLPMTPELYSMVAPFEGQALSMLDRIRYHDPGNYPPPRNGLPPYRESFDARADLFSRHCRFWNHAFDKHEINAVIAQNFGHQGFDFVALSLAKAKGIPTLILNESGVFPRVQFVQENVSELGTFELGKELKRRISHEMLPEDPGFVRNSIRIYEKAPDRFGAMADYSTSSLRSWLLDLNVRVTQPSFSVILATFFRKLRRFKSQPVKRLRMVIPTIIRIRKTRSSMFEERRYSQVPDLESKFVYFPLHFQPEASTSVKGRHFYRLREAVSFIAENLPEGWNLIVKEHPHQWRRFYSRQPGFFSQLSAIPGVQLVHHSHDNHILVEQSQAVVCVSHSSITSFANSRGKAVISLGHSHFRQSPNYFCIDSTDELRRVFHEVSIGIKPVTPDDRERFVRELELGTFEGLLGYTPKHITSDEYNRIRQVTQRNVSLLIREWLQLRTPLRPKSTHLVHNSHT
jgi:hypothetical protein